MREYGQLQIEFWSDPKVLQLSDQAKILMVYLITGPHSNSLGCMRVPTGYIQDDLNWERDTVETRCEELVKQGLVHRDWKTGWTLLPRFLKHNPPANNSVAANLEKLFRKVPDEVAIYPSLVEALASYGTRLDGDFRAFLEEENARCSHRVDTVPAREQEQDPEQDQEQEHDPDQEGRADPPSQPEPPEPEQADQLPAAPEAAGDPPNKSGGDKHQGNPENRETWEAYAAEYHRRYGVEPIRNAKVNTQIANFVKRVGKENAPHVAAFYVRHNGQFYVGRGHQVGIMLNDAEKLYTEWASGQKVTAKAARDADRLEEAGQGWEELKREGRHG